MCGIVAMLSPEAPVTAATINRALGTLEHRGPDGRRQWISADDANKVTALLDALPALSPADRAPLDVGLMAMTSVCMLGELFHLAA